MKIISIAILIVLGGEAVMAAKPPVTRARTVQFLEVESISCAPSPPRRKPPTPSPSPTPSPKEQGSQLSQLS